MKLKRGEKVEGFDQARLPLRNNSISILKRITGDDCRVDSFTDIKIMFRLLRRSILQQLEPFCIFRFEKHFSVDNLTIVHICVWAD